ncbi:phenylacetate--CoA ligase, partial [Anaerolineae bacterium CFX7]|nr:phenylacetate--CoA ligase [Anaerolineae bacterium CFX7]
FLGEAERARIQRELLDLVGLSVTPTFVAAGTLARPAGKAVRVVDKRKS